MEAFKNIRPENKDKTKSLAQKIQKKLLELKKSNKLEEINYKKIYPSGFKTPYSYTLNIISHRNTHKKPLPHS